MVTALVAALLALAGPPGRAVAATSQTTVGVIVTGAPALAVAKRGTVVDVEKDGRIGADRVRWTITVSNTGNTMLSGLTVSDPTAGVVRCPSTSLVPAQVVTCSVPDHVITVADVSAGVVTNVATASATAPGGQISSRPAYASVPIATGRPAVILPLPPTVFGLPHTPADHPDSGAPVKGGAVVGGAVVGGAVGGGSALNPGSGPGAAGPGAPHAQSPGPSPAGDQPRAHPPEAVAGGQPDEPGRGGLTMVLLGAVTAAGALGALGALARRRTRHRR